MLSSQVDSVSSHQYRIVHGWVCPGWISSQYQGHCLHLFIWEPWALLMALYDVVGHRESHLWLIQ